MTTEETTRLVARIVCHAIDGEHEHAAELLTDLGTTSDSSRMYGVCCAFGEVGKAALTKIYGDRAPNPTRGDMWAITELQPGALADDPAAAFANRFLIAYSNDDEDIALALYNTALAAGPEPFVESVCSLLANAAGLARLALDQGQDT